MEYLKIMVKTQMIDDYPELFEAYKRQMAQAMRQRGFEPDEEHLTVLHGRDDPLCTDLEKELSTMVLFSKEEA